MVGRITEPPACSCLNAESDYVTLSGQRKFVNVLKDFEMGEYAGLSGGSNGVTRVLIGGRQEGQSQRRWESRSRGQADGCCWLRSRRKGKGQSLGCRKPLEAGGGQGQTLPQSRRVAAWRCLQSGSLTPFWTSGLQHHQISKPVVSLSH